MNRSQRRIFIDCGANSCRVLRTNVKKRPDFEFYAFEPQPELEDRAKQVLHDFPERKIEFYNKAVWVANERKAFYLATRWGPNYKGGSTLLGGHLNNRAKIDYSNPIYVDALDFSEWLGSNFSRNDFVVIKMDIEGAEYEVFEKIIQDGNHHIIKEAFVEFHYRMNDTITKPRHDSLVAKIRSFAKLVIWH
jgi:FkbM family methyltransferase